MDAVTRKYIALLENNLNNLLEERNALMRVNDALSVNNHKIDCKNSDIQYLIPTTPDPVILHDAYVWHCPCGWKNIERPIPIELNDEEKDIVRHLTDTNEVPDNIGAGKPETVCCSYCGDVRSVAVDYTLISEYYDQEANEDPEQVDDEDREQ